MVPIFVVATFVLFIVADMLVLKAQKKRHPALSGISDYAVFNKKSFLSPEAIYLSKGHTWAKFIQDGLVNVGIDDFVVKALGNVSLTNIAAPGTTVKYGDIIFEGQSGSRHLSFRSPVAGVVKASNTALKQHKIEDAYSSWGVAIMPENAEASVKNLRTGKDMTEWLRDEFTKLKDFLAQNSYRAELVGLTMQDGGNIMEGAVSNIQEEGMHQFENEFLKF